MEKLIETQQEKRDRLEYYLNDYYGSNFIDGLHSECRLLQRIDPESNPERDYFIMLLGSYRALRQNR